MSNLVENVQLMIPFFKQAGLKDKIYLKVLKHLVMEGQPLELNLYINKFKENLIFVSTHDSYIMNKKNSAFFIENDLKIGNICQLFLNIKPLMTKTNIDYTGLGQFIPSQALVLDLERKTIKLISSHEFYQARQ